MATIQFRPLLVGGKYTEVSWIKRINYKWILQRAPMILFALVSSYGVGHLLHISDIPFPFDYIGSISFDVGFLGAIALADMQLRKNVLSIIAYYTLNITMALTAALFNVLSHAGGLYQNISAEHITVGIPFALGGLAFAFYYHSVMSQQMEQELQQQETTKEPCKYCGEGKPSKQAVYGHYASCQMKKTHDTLKDAKACPCKICRP